MLAIVTFRREQNSIHNVSLEVIETQKIPEFLMRSQHKDKKSRYSIFRKKPELKYDRSTLDTGSRSQVLKIRNLTSSAYILRFDRHGIKFTPGQHVTLGLPGENQIREYSIYSATNKPYFEVLIKDVEEGLVSRKLHRVKEGDILNFDGPFGFFTIDQNKIDSHKYLFIATGTGIAPFHSIVGSYPSLNYKILHGIRYLNETYEKHFYLNNCYIACTSRDANGDFQGRITDYLQYHKIETDTLVYLCGNSEMIYDVYDMLISGGFNADQIKSEVYF